LIWNKPSRKEKNIILANEIDPISVSGIHNDSFAANYSTERKISNVQ
jgi:hypothetical protein